MQLVPRVPLQAHLFRDDNLFRSSQAAILRTAEECRTMLDHKSQSIPLAFGVENRPFLEINISYISNLCRL